MALLASSVVSAETINFTGSPCNANRVCSPVAVDTTDTVSLYSYWVYPATIYINGQPYVMDYIPGATTSLDAIVTSPEGYQGHLVVNFNYWTTKVTSGRLAGRLIKHWEIMDGSFSR